MKLMSTCRLFVVLATIFISAKSSAQTDSAVWTNTTKVPAGFGYPTSAFDSAGFSTAGLTTDTLTLAKIGLAKTLKPKVATSPYDNLTYSMREYAATDTGGVAVAPTGIWEGNAAATGKPDRYIQFNVKANSALYITSVKASLVSSGGGAVTADFYYSTDGWATSNLLVLGSVQKLSKDTMHTFTLELPSTVSLTSGQTFSLRLLPFNNSKTPVTGKLLGFEDIVIYANPTPLPVKFGSISANLINSQAKISWTSLSEINVLNYSIEKSADGTDFKEIGTTPATKSVNYSFTDKTVTGTSYYRIKSTDATGSVTYSSVVKVLGQTKVGATVFPNPVTNHTLNLQIAGIDAGKYAINIYSISGQRVSTTSINVAGGSLSQSVVLPSAVKAGTYQLELTNGSTKVVKAISVQ